MIVAFVVALIALLISQLIVSNGKSTHSPLVAPVGDLLIVDTETNGFPLDWTAPLNDTNNWPRIVSIAWNRIAPNGELLSSNYQIIRPDGYRIQTDATQIHGISNEDAIKNGVSITDIINEFEEEIAKCKYLVAHNIEFDYAVLYAEYLRLKKDTSILSSIKKVCTMKQSTMYCKIPSSKGYKYPKLNELYIRLFGVQLSGIHSAKNDAEACMKCFKELYNRKIIKL